MSGYFTKLVTEVVPQEKIEESMNWYRKAAFESEKPDTDKVIRGAKKYFTNRERMGHVYTFRYQPKYKDVLPFYDRYPVIIMVETKPDGFLGLNLHYLPFVFRATLMDQLTNYKTGEDDLARFRVNYSILSNVSKLRYYKPCLKYYLNSQIRTRMVHVEVDDWESALFLPLQQFKKKPESTVYKDSLRQIRKARTL